MANWVMWQLGNWATGQLGNWARQPGNQASWLCRWRTTNEKMHREQKDWVSGRESPRRVLEDFLPRLMHRDYISQVPPSWPGTERGPKSGSAPKSMPRPPPFVLVVLVREADCLPTAIYKSQCLGLNCAWRQKKSLVLKFTLTAVKCRGGT